MAERMEISEAKRMLDDGFHCSQVVMYHAAQKLGLDPDFALKATAGLGAGTNHGDTCGVVSAGIIALSVLYGFDRKPTPEQDQLLIGKVKEFENCFMEKHGSLLCRDILPGFDAACDCKADAAPDTWDICPFCCESACEILDSMLAEKGIF